MGSAEDSERYSTPEELRCLPFGTRAVLIWRGEKNRGDHQTIQNRAGERSINGGRRRRNDFE